MDSEADHETVDSLDEEDDSSTIENSRDGDSVRAPSSDEGVGSEGHSLRGSTTSIPPLPLSNSSQDSDTDETCTTPTGNSIGSAIGSFIGRSIPRKASTKAGASSREGEPKKSHRRAKSLKAILSRGASVDTGRGEREKEFDAPTTTTASSRDLKAVFTSSHDAVGTTTDSSSDSHPSAHLSQTRAVPPRRLSRLNEDGDDEGSDEEGDHEGKEPEGEHPHRMNWSNFEERYCGDEVQQDPLACDILLFPPDDLSIVAEERAARTTASTLPVRSFVGRCNHDGAFLLMSFLDCRAKCWRARTTGSWMDGYRHAERPSSPHGRW